MASDNLNISDEVKTKLNETSEKLADEFGPIDYNPINAGNLKDDFHKKHKFDSCSMDEQIQRLRTAVQELQLANRYMAELLQTTRRYVIQHTHAKGGDPALSLRDIEYSSVGLADYGGNISPLD